MFSLYLEGSLTCTCIIITALKESSLTMVKAQAAINIFKDMIDVI